MIQAAKPKPRVKAVTTREDVSDQSDISDDEGNPSAERKRKAYESSTAESAAAEEVEGLKATVDTLNRTIEQDQERIDFLTNALKSVQGQLKEMMDFKKEIEEAGGLPGNPVQSTLLTPAELVLKALFPIYFYTKEVEFLLQQELVGKFVRNEMIRQLYTGTLSTRPGAVCALSVFIEYTTSKRLQVKGIRNIHLEGTDWFFFLTSF